MFAQPQVPRPHAHQRQQAAVAPGLRIATLNVGGMRSAAVIHRLVREAQVQHLHIIALQETWIGAKPHITEAAARLWLQQAAESLHTSGYVPFWGHNSTADSHYAGVAILVREDFIRAGLVLSDPTVTPDGRVIAMRIKWAGHDLHLVNVYWPNEPTAQRHFLDTVLSAAIQHVPQGRLVLLGDFNHVQHPAVDRTPLPSGQATNAARQTEQLTAARMQATLGSTHDLRDAFRVLHPRTHGYTCHRWGSSSRIDRIYVSAGTWPHVLSCEVGQSVISDHSPVLLHLLPITPLHRRGQGIRPVNQAFLASGARRQWLTDWSQRAVQYGLSLTPEQLLDWWPHLKTALRSAAKGLQASFSLATTAAGQQEEEARQAWLLAQTAVEQATPADVAQATQQALHARAVWKQAAMAARAPSVSVSRASWLHTNETPSPLITKLLCSHAPSGIAALRLPGGQVTTDSSEMAEHAAQSFARAAAAARCSPVAQRMVLDSMVRQQGLGYSGRITPHAAQLAGSTTITIAEVQQALADSKADTSPGPDGIPVELWQVGEGVWAPLLARLYTAMGTLQRLPQHYLRGVVAVIYKRGAAADIKNYRPITLLNTDYRLLTSVLATRFGTALSPAMGMEQTAFLPGRQIGDNIMALQLLPALLTSLGMSAAVVSLDIAQAYDSVCRHFLYAAMEAKGAAGGMVQWAQLLLSDTCAAAMVNGAVSRPQRWDAGVRQGCPLSPYLYLFISDALASWLREQPQLGLQLGNTRHTSLHYADDTDVFVPDLQQETAEVLTHTMATFAAATGQRSNNLKSAVLPVGVQLVDPPDTFAGIKVVPILHTLGVMLSNSPMLAPLPARLGLRDATRRWLATPAAQSHHIETAQQQLWDARVQAVQQACNRLRRLPLSVMGRGLAASGYAVSKVLYYAEFDDFPQHHHSTITTAVNTLVDRGRGTALPGVPSRLLSGSPKVGGFGVLPLREHTQARHLSWASRLLVLLLRKLRPTQSNHPVQPPQPPQPTEPPWMHMAEDMLRLVCPTLHPVQTLLAASCSSQRDLTEGKLTAVSVQAIAIPPGPLQRMAAALCSMGPVTHQAQSPPPGLARPDPSAVTCWLRQPEANTHNLVSVLTGLGWPCNSQSMPAPQHNAQQHQQHSAILPAVNVVPVRVGTAYLTRSVQVQRSACHQEYALQALGITGVGRRGQHHEHLVTQALATVWRLPWEGKHKEILWRLAVNGVAGAGGHGIQFTSACPCGHQPSGASATEHRLHAFWDCPVAQEIRQQLAHGCGGEQPARQHVWLLQSPSRGCQQGVWQVVGLAALNAMEYGRSRLWAQTLQADSDRQGGHRRADMLSTVQQAAVAFFWSEIQDFVVHRRGVAPAGWDSIQAGHPFIQFRPDTGLCLHVPHRQI